MRILIQDGLLERSTNLGAYAMKKFKEMAKEREVIGDVRGMGLGIALEMVRDRKSKEPLQTGEMVRIIWGLRDRGVFVLPCGRNDNVLRVIPPLVTPKSYIDKSIKIISEVLEMADMSKYSLNWTFA